MRLIRIVMLKSWTLKIHFLYCILLVLQVNPKECYTPRQVIWFTRPIPSKTYFNTKTKMSIGVQLILGGLLDIRISSTDLLQTEQPQSCLKEFLLILILVDSGRLSKNTKSINSIQLQQRLEPLLKKI